jgi:fucose 4-O-acetylase-like acetyltransferase
LGTFARRKIVRLGYPYLIWASAQTLLQVALARYTNHPVELSSLWTLAFAPPMQFWFLYALLLQALFIGAFAKLGGGRAALVYVSAALFITAPLVQIGPWLVLYQARHALVYTALGCWAGQPGKLASLAAWSTRRHLITACAGFVAVALYATWGHTQHHLAFLPAVCGSVAVLSACSLIARRAGGAGRLSRHLEALGRASLAIFVAHTLASAAVRIGLQKWLGVEDVTLHVVAGVFVGTYAPFLLYCATQQGAGRFLFEWVKDPPRPKSPRTSWA